MRKKRLIQKDKIGALVRIKLSEPVADTPLAERMIKTEGPEMLSLLKTFQQHFGAKLLHYQDADGEVGKRPGWML